MLDKNLVIGVAGCGAMGLPMALRLIDAGYTVWGFDVRPSHQFFDFAPRLLESASELSQRCDVVISVVRDQLQPGSCCSLSRAWSTQQRAVIV